MKILVSYRGIPESPGWATGDSVVRALRNIGHEAIPYGRYYKTGKPLGKVPQNVDLLIYMECNDPEPQYVELAGLRCKKVYWEFDTAMHFRFSQQFVDMMGFDKVFLANPDYIPAFPGSHYLPYAADTDLFKPGKRRREGIALIGSDFPERRKFCEEAGIELISGVYREQYVEALQKLKVHVHNFSSGGSSLLVMRIFETMACGALLLAEYQDTMEKHFYHGENYLRYQNIKSALRFIGKYHDEIERIRKAGLREIRKKHTYAHRVKELLECL